MPDFKQTFQDEVRRLARKELKAFEAKINEQKKTINALTKRVNELEKELAAARAEISSEAMRTSSLEVSLTKVDLKKNLEKNLE